MNNSASQEAQTFKGNAMQTLDKYISIHCFGDKEAAAERLGVSRATIYNNMKHGRVLNHNLYTCKRLNKGEKK